MSKSKKAGLKPELERALRILQGKFPDLEPETRALWAEKHYRASMKIFHGEDPRPPSMRGERRDFSNWPIEVLRLVGMDNQGLRQWAQERLLSALTIWIFLGDISSLQKARNDFIQSGWLDRLDFIDRAIATVKDPTHPKLGIAFAAEDFRFFPTPTSPRRPRSKGCP